MKISNRLFLAVVPSIIGLFTVAGLAYWGAFHRAAPEWVVVIAAVSAVGSLFLAWQNTRYVARRIERLAGGQPRHDAAALSPFGVVRRAAVPMADTTPDELDSIEEVVDHLTSAVTVAQAAGEARDRAAAARIREYAVLLDEGSTAVRRQLTEARVALHILREHHFGPLNDNQEEMLEAARAGTEAADTELARLQDIAQLDRGAISVRRDTVRIADVLHSLRPQLEADAVRVGVTLSLDVVPGLPRITGDRVRLQQALEYLLRHIIRHAPAGDELTIALRADHDRVCITVLRGPAPTLDADVALARRIIEAHGGRIDVVDGETTVALPVSTAGRPLRADEARATSLDADPAGLA